MALRFFLMSAVASLGLTLPEEGEIRKWAAEAQRWANTKLAEWDVPSAGEERVTDLASRPEVSVPREAAQGDWAFDAAMEEMLRSFAIERPTAPTFEPMVIGEDLYTGTAFELNRASEGSNIARLTTGDREVRAGCRSMAVARECPSDMTHSLSRGESGPVQGLAKKACGRSRGDFEPMVVGDDLYVGVAYELNRASEGLGLASEDFISPSPAARGSEPAVSSRISQLSVALRLTREAVYAWSNLLHGPAVVAITR